MSTSLFRKSLCVRMRISSLINDPTLAISAGRRHIFAFFNRADEEHRVLRSFFTTAGGTGHRQFNFPSPQSKEGKNHLILFFRFCGKLRGNVAGVEMSPLVYVRRNYGQIEPRIADLPLARASLRSRSAFRVRGARGGRFSWRASTSATWQIRC